MAEALEILKFPLEGKHHSGKDDSYNIAKIMSSDAHKLISLGKNLSGTKKLTRIKMDELNFSSFRVAFLDANSRIRIEESIPTSFPKFIGMEFEGGILDNNKIHFSDNFNSIYFFWDWSVFRDTRNEFR